MTSFLEMINDTVAAIKDRAYAEIEADERIAQAADEVIQFAKCHAGNGDIIRTLIEPPILSQLGIPMEQAEKVRDTIMDIRYSYIRQYGDKPVTILENNE